MQYLFICKKIDLKIQGSLLILDMGNFRTSIITCEFGNLEYTLSVPISGDSFTQALVHAMQITEDQAEAIKAKDAAIHSLESRLADLEKVVARLGQHGSPSGQ